MCLFPFLGSLWHSHAESLHYVSAIVFILNVFALTYYCIELHVFRKLKCCHLSHAYLAVLLSMISATISSMFFTLASVNSPYSEMFCSIGPILALSFRTLSKSFTWALYIVRGQMVIESLDNPILSLLTQYAPYILGLQCILLTSLVAFFTQTGLDTNTNHNQYHCTASLPLWLLICSAMIGEVLYGLGFLYIFYLAMSTSLHKVYKAVTRQVADNTKKEIRHHIKVYMIQLISSMLFLLFVSSCICFQTLLFFDAELFVSNLCLLVLFRHKRELITNTFKWPKYCCCSTALQSGDETLPPIMANMMTRARIYSERAVTFNNKNVTSVAPHTNYFFSNKWRTSREVINMKHALKAHTIPQAAKENEKVLEIMGVKAHINDTQSSDILTLETVRSLSSYTDRRHSDMVLSASSITSEGQMKHLKFLSMSDASIPTTLRSIPAEKVMSDEIPQTRTSMNRQFSKSTTDISTAHRSTKDKEIISQSECLLSAQDAKTKGASSFIVRVASFMNKFRKPETANPMQVDPGNASPFKEDTSTNPADAFAAFDTLDRFSDNISSLSDPITSMHQNGKQYQIKMKCGHKISASTPMDRL
eukprot:11134_1